MMELPKLGRVLQWWNCLNCLFVLHELHACPIINKLVVESLMTFTSMVCSMPISWLQLLQSPGHPQLSYRLKSRWPMLTYFSDFFLWVETQKVLVQLCAGNRAQIQITEIFFMARADLSPSGTHVHCTHMANHLIDWALGLWLKYQNRNDILYDQDKLSTGDLSKGREAYMGPIRCKTASTVYSRSLLNSLRPRQNGRHFADHILKCIFLNENAWIPIKMSLKFVPRAWCQTGNNSLFKPMMVSLLTHICITRHQTPQCVLWYRLRHLK